MTSSYSPWLLCLSIGVAVMVSFTSLRLACRVAESQGLASRIWLILGSISMGVGIWSMHFIGMLAFSVPVALRYDIDRTLLSLGVAIVTSGFAITIASRARLGIGRHVVCSLVMGLGIVSMHYVGMSAILISPAITYNRPVVAASGLVAVLASFVALWLTFNLRRTTHRWVWMARLGAALVMGLAIAGMHYIGMAAAQFALGATCSGGVALDNQWLALVVSIATFSLLIITLVAGVFDAHLEMRVRGHARWLEKVNSQLNFQATHDTLTNLPNRVQFLGVLQSAIEAAEAKPSNTLLAVMLVDLDRFKIVNDSLGHSYGDAILKEAGTRLRYLLRDGEMAARLGGDEFLMLIKTNDARSVINRANEVVLSLGKTYNIEAVELHLAASVGITTYPFDRSAADVLISHADEAMYDAKHNGGNGIRFFVPGTTVFTVARLHLENDLRIAPQLGQLELHYQPQVEIRSGSIVGLEALARWQHPVHGWVPPDEFIPLAEASDLIVQIGRWILDAACKQLRLWHLEGFSDLSVAVNLSARQFRQPDLLGMIQKTVASHGLQPRHVVIELTESVVMSDAHRSFDTLEKLDRLGFKVAVDDFGTGYSSMSYLKRLPVDKLKVDRSFVSDLGASTKSDSIVKAIISLAHGLGMTVVAEGVETNAQRDLLAEFGCDQFQGYLFSRPRNAADIVELLKAKPQPLEEFIEGAQIDALLESTS
jgi:diguanylate cyclase (GGDEF)-like protein